MKKDKEPLLYNILKTILRPFFKLLYPVKTIDKGNIPKQGAIIFCGNHLNFKDQFPVILATRRTIHWMSKKEYFEGKFAWFFRLTGCIAVDRNNHGGNSLKIAKKYLEEGRSIGIFPEGTRNKTNKELLPFKIGAVYLAQKTKATIIPFAMTGDFKIRSHNLVLRFGKPFKISSNKNLDEANQELYNTILALQRKNYKETN